MILIPLQNPNDAHHFQHEMLLAQVFHHCVSLHACFPRLCHSHHTKCEGPSRKKESAAQTPATTGLIAHFGALVGLLYLGREIFTHRSDAANESDLQLFAKELNETLIVKVRGVLLNRIARYGQSTNGRPFLEWEAGPRRGHHHGNARSETCRSHQDSEFTRHQEKHG